MNDVRRPREEIAPGSRRTSGRRREASSAGRLVGTRGRRAIADADRVRPQMAPGIADYFAGPPPEEFLAARCTEVLKLNPWLAGRLKTVDGELSLVWDDDPSGTPAGDDFYRVVDASALGLEDVTSAFEAVTRISGQHEGALPAALEACVCKAGVFCADKDEPVFRVLSPRGYSVEMSRGDAAV